MKNTITSTTFSLLFNHDYETRHDHAAFFFSIRPTPGNEKWGVKAKPLVLEARFKRRTRDETACFGLKSISMGHSGRMSCNG